jgi:hypothetical protein
MTIGRFLDEHQESGSAHGSRAESFWGGRPLVRSCGNCWPLSFAGQSECDLCWISLARCFFCEHSIGRIK